MKKVCATSHCNKNAMLEALTKSMGSVTKACKQVGIGRTTHYKWINKDKDYAKQVTNIQDMVSKSLLKECKHCGKLFENKKHKEVVFCSMKCRGLHDRTRVVCVCATCGNKVEKSPYKIQNANKIYCSIKCRGLSQRKPYVEKIKYKKYTREENRACKLSEQDIKDIRRLHKEGYACSKIAKIFNVHYDTAYCWLNPEYKKKKSQRWHDWYLRNREEYLKKLKETGQVKAWRKRFVHNKLKHFPSFPKWCKQQDKLSPYQQSENRAKKYKQKKALKRGKQ